MRWHWFIPWRGKAEQRGLRGLLNAVAPTWRASPLRRGCQTTCFVAFLVLFAYVCWPYTARRARSWHDWLPQDVDGQTGQATLVAQQPPAEPVTNGAVLYAIDRGTDPPQDLGRLRVVAAEQAQLTVVPADPPTPEQLQRMPDSFGPWSLSEAAPGSWPSHYADNLEAKELKLPSVGFVRSFPFRLLFQEKVQAELPLALDPLLSISTALAGKTWVWSLGVAAMLLVVCLVIPRGFCGYVCPLGTLIDLCDWAAMSRVPWLRLSGRGWWASLKYYLLLATLVASLCGVLLAGFVSAIPLITRALAFAVTPWQTAAVRGWHQMPPIGAAGYLSLGLFAAILLLGLLRPRFWCAYLCPTGAVFSSTNLLRLSQRRVDSRCIGCGRCVDACPFDAIRPDFTTRTADCTFCQTCGGVCPVHAIEFGPRSYSAQTTAGSPPAESLPAQRRSRSRRGFLGAALGAVGGTAGGLVFAGAAWPLGARLNDRAAFRPVRPPGSVPEQQFLQLCIRCGECFQACPNSVLQPLGFQQGIEGLWTPHVVADWSGCEPSCSNCGQVCPTGAIRALRLEEKRAAHIGLAVVNQQTCLPYALRGDCQLCIDECNAAGYHAIAPMRVGTEVDESGQPIEGSGFLTPVVNADRCVGCGLCQTRCLAINAVEKQLLRESAICVEAGEGKEDRLTGGSYAELHQPPPQPAAVKPGDSADPGGQGRDYLPPSP